MNICICYCVLRLSMRAHSGTLSKGTFCSNSRVLFFPVILSYRISSYGHNGFGMPSFQIDFIVSSIIAPTNRWKCAHSAINFKIANKFGPNSVLNGFNLVNQMLDMAINYVGRRIKINKNIPSHFVAKINFIWFHKSSGCPILYVERDSVGFIAFHGFASRTQRRATQLCRTFDCVWLYAMILCLAGMCVNPNFSPKMVLKKSLSNIVRMIHMRIVSICTGRNAPMALQHFAN